MWGNGTVGRHSKINTQSLILTGSAGHSGTYNLNNYWLTI